MVLNDTFPYAVEPEARGDATQEWTVYVVVDCRSGERASLTDHLSQGAAENEAFELHLFGDGEGHFPTYF